MTHNLDIFSSLILISFFISLTSCDKNNDCGECLTPPGPIGMRLIDKTDSTDLFYSGIYNPDSTDIYYIDSFEKIHLQFNIFIDTINQSGIITLNDITWKSAGGQKNFYLELNHVEIDTIFLNVESITENCCTTFPVLGFSINGIELELNSTDRIYYYLK